MQQVPPDEVSDLIKGWDSALDEATLDRLGMASDDLRSAVRRRVLTELTRPVVDV
jgi:hypothetical protein